MALNFFIRKPYIQKQCENAIKIMGKKYFFFQPTILNVAKPSIKDL